MATEPVLEGLAKILEGVRVDGRAPNRVYRFNKKAGVDYERYDFHIQTGIQEDTDEESQTVLTYFFEITLWFVADEDGDPDHMSEMLKWHDETRRVLKGKSNRSLGNTVSNTVLAPVDGIVGTDQNQSGGIWWTVTFRLAAHQIETD